MNTFEFYNRRFEKMHRHRR